MMRVLRSFVVALATMSDTNNNKEKTIIIITILQPDHEVKSKLLCCRVTLVELPKLEIFIQPIKDPRNKLLIQRIIQPNNALVQDAYQHWSRMPTNTGPGCLPTLVQDAYQHWSRMPLPTYQLHTTFHTEHHPYIHYLVRHSLRLSFDNFCTLNKRDIAVY